MSTKHPTMRRAGVDQTGGDPNRRVVRRRRARREPPEAHTRAQADRPGASKLDAGATEGGAQNASPPPASAPELPEAHAVTAAREKSATGEPAERQGPSVDPDALLSELESLGPAELARLMELESPVDIKVGDQVTGTVVRAGPDAVFVDVGGKSEAYLDPAEFRGAPLPAPGDEITALVLSADERGIRLSRQLTGRASRDFLTEALQTGVPVEGRVESRNTGGFTVMLGFVRAFCPVSQIDRHAGADLDAYLGRTLPFRVMEVSGHNVVVSHRVIAEEEAAAAAERLWEELKPGESREGVVTGARDFGIFVDVGGIQGLVHKSELPWEIREGEAATPQRGTHVQVYVLDVDREARKLSLSMKDPSTGPWSRVGTEFLVGEVYTGKVTRLASFGAFVELAPGLEGLVHISAMADRRIRHPGEVVKVGQEVQVRLLSADGTRERLELSMRAVDEPGAGAPTHHEDHGSLGTFADLLADFK